MAMVTPVILVVDDEAGTLQTLGRELESRYGTHYRIVASASGADAVARLADVRRSTCIRMVHEYLATA